MQNNDNVIEKKDFGFSFNIAKTKDAGEDADPILIRNENLYFLAVCDGMGGAGSTSYEIDGVQKSGAYISSRLVIKEAKNFFSNLLGKGATFNENNLGELKNALLQQLHLKLREIKKNEESKLKSRLLKDLPTTFSGLFIIKAESTVDVCSIWAGDSRNYLFTQTEGLQQLSLDDLKQKYDPLENLSKDSPLDNVVSADGDFTIRLKKISTSLPCILFTATDGCYGYFNTPMQFEYAILNSLLNSNTFDEWKEKLIAEIGTVAGDDYSISLLSLGFESFSAIKSHFSQRLQDVYRQFVKDLQKNDEVLSDWVEKKARIEDSIKSVDSDRTILQRKIWQEYKKIYLKHIES